MNRIKQFIAPGGWKIEPEREFDMGSLFQCDNPEWGVLAEFESLSAISFIRELSDQLSGKAAENARLREEIDELAERVDKHEELLRELLAPSGLPEAGAFEQWLASGDSVNSYRGKHVAYVPEKGVIASADSLDNLVEAVDEMGRIEGLTIGFVPVASASFSKC